MILEQKQVCEEKQFVFKRQMLTYLQWKWFLKDYFLKSLLVEEYN